MAALARRLLASATVTTAGGGVLGLAASIAVPFIGGAFGAVYTSREIPRWYNKLVKPSYNPPSWLFGPAWTVLYVCMGTAAWLVATHGGGIRAQALPLGVYAVQLGLNIVWSPIFFGQHRMRLALLDMSGMWLGIAACIGLFYLISPVASALMVPYLSWVSFASLLTYKLIQLNPEEARKRF